MWGSYPDKRAYQQEWATRADHVSGISRPAHDPLSAAVNSRRHLGVSARPLHGRVIDGVAYTQCYRVAFESGHPPMPCVLGALTSLLPVGTRQVNSLVPGTMVWVLVHPQLTYGVIIAVEPSWATDPTLALSDVFHQSSRCGLRVDGVHHSILRLNGNGGVIDWSAGRPFDGTLGGEWGAMSETGMRVTVDSAMAQLGAGEGCGVFAFYDDEMLRIAGINLTAYSAGSEDEVLLDEGEVSIYRGETPYPWEQCGVLRPGQDPFRDVAAAASQVAQPYYAAVEPRQDDQMPFHRVLRLGGYPGQGGREMVLLPPAGSLYGYSSGAAPAAAFEQFTTLAGRRVVRSAKGILLVKQPAIPGPKRIARPEGPNGDTGANYMFAGLQGNGPEHKITDQVRAEGDLPSLQRAAGAMDTVSFACNWEGVHALHYHSRDWLIPEESATPAGKNQSAVDYQTLAARFYLPEPATVDQAVDHRYGDVPYFLNTSFISLLDDGGVAIRGGNGESITLAGGHITLSAPGDIWLKSGRDVLCWSGYDVILRAKHSVEGSATEGDVRLKAEKNLQMVAGNDGSTGAVLIESKAPSSYGYKDVTGEDVAAGGVQIKCAKGDVVAWARDIYLRTGGGDVESGLITLDADKGRQGIYTHSRDFVRYMPGVAADYFGTSGNVTAANLFGAETNVLARGLVVGDFVEITKGGLAVRGNVSIDQGHVFSQLAAQYKFLVPEITGLPLASLERAIQEGIDDVKAIIKQGKDGWKELFAAFWYGPQQAGEDETIAAVGFSFRSAAQYRTADFMIFEDPWQQAARMANSVPATWTEKPVRAGASATYPYPGKEKWRDEATMVEQDLTLFDPAAGVSRPRGAAYEDPKFGAQKPVKPDGNYAVII